MQTSNPRSRASLTARVTSLGVSATSFFGREAVGGVCASFRRSCYVHTCEGEILCIADEALGRGPLTISIRLVDGMDLQTLGIVEDMPVLVEDECLLLGPLELPLQDAEVWRPQPVGRVVDSRVVQRARRLAMTLSSQVPCDGLGCLLFHIETLASGQGVNIDDSTPIVGMASKSMAGLVNGAVAGDIPRIEAGVRGLLGLGPGLTPSGDDLLVGALLALHSAKSPGAESLSHVVAANGPAMTGAISVSMLYQASLGLGSEASHELIAALVEGHPASDLWQRTHTLTAVGHTSGWDTLVGILLGLHLAERLAP